MKERGFQDLPVGRWLGAEVEVTTQGAGRETIGLEKKKQNPKLKFLRLQLLEFRIVGISDKSRS